MIIDSHFHYLKEEFNLEETVHCMERDGISKIALMAEICGGFSVDPNALPMKFMRHMAGKPVYFPLFKALLSTFEEGGVKVLGEHVPIYFIPDNDIVFQQVDADPKHFYGYVTLNPGKQSVSEMKKELDKYSSHPNFCGIKTHPFYYQYNSKELEPLLQFLQPLHKPLLVHMGFGDYRIILKLADKYPDVNIVLAHCAFPFFDMIWPQIKKRPNLYVDISSACYVDAKIARRAVNALGPEHVLYGSDGPYGDRLADGSYDMKSAYMFAANRLNSDELSHIDSQNFLKLIH